MAKTKTNPANNKNKSTPNKLGLLPLIGAATIIVLLGAWIATEIYESTQLDDTAQPLIDDYAERKQLASDWLDLGYARSTALYGLILANSAPDSQAQLQALQQIETQATAKRNAFQQLKLSKTEQYYLTALEQLAKQLKPELLGLLDTRNNKGQAAAKLYYQQRISPLQDETAKALRGLFDALDQTQQSIIVQASKIRSTARTTALVLALAVILSVLIVGTLNFRRLNSLSASNRELSHRIQDAKLGMQSHTANSQADIELLKQESEQATKDRICFFANLSHELRTSMMGVTGMTDMLLASPLNDQQQSQAMSIQQSSEALLELTNDLLDFAKLESGGLKLEMQPFNPDEQIEKSVGQIAVRVAGQGIRLMHMPNADLPHQVRGDAARLRQALNNLIRMAATVMDGGLLLISTSYNELDKQCQIRFNIRVQSTAHTITLLNALIASEDYSGNEVLERYCGTVLELNIAGHLLGMMSGGVSLEVESETDSVISAEAQFDTIDTAVTAHQVIEELRGARLMLVTDNELSRDALSILMGEQSVEITHANSGHETLEHLLSGEHDSAFDAILIERELGDMTGSQLATQIQANPSIPRRPMVMICGPGQEAELPMLRGHGIVACLSRPFKRDALYACLKRCMEISHVQQSPPSKAAAMNTNNRLTGKVLVVEDTPVNQQVAMAMLENLGLDVEVAENGQEAVDAFDSDKFDAILMDIQMPVMDGLEATEIIREKEAGKSDGIRTPIIAVTANVTENDRKRCHAAGMDDFLPKPFQKQALRDALLVFLG